MVLWSREYCIENAELHRRTIDTTGEAPSTALQVRWERVTPDELSSHMTTVAAHWLCHKPGPDELSRACAQNTSLPSNEIVKREQLRRGIAELLG
jgi:hypothetical protein